MATLNQFTGVEEVVINMRGARKKMATGVSKGLRIAGLTLQRQSMLLVPVDYGILKASAFTRAEGTGFNTDVRVGYTAGYAAFVHELVAMKLKGLPRDGGGSKAVQVGDKTRTFRSSKKGKYWDPQGRAQAKFLEAPFRAFRPILNQIVKDAVTEELTT